MNLEALPWLILFLPLLAAGIITLFTLRNKAVSATLSIGAIVTGFVLTLAVIKFGGWEARELSVNWLSIGSLNVDFGLRLDALSLMMMLIVTGVGGAIHIYSYGYMHDDPGFSRFFACMSLFTFSMLGIVLSNNFLQMFIFWELVGVSSYLLIGFWFEKPSAADACKKAFITNRLGDFGFMLGILTFWGLSGSLGFDTIKAWLANGVDIGSKDILVVHLGLGFAGLLIFCGAMGKSAQFPLHVWLPDAMEGPTPVSALIHAATMVAAGVYMISRVFFIFTPEALTVIAWIGGFTALLAALIAVQQNDIKRILAYSTLSQLGYMVMALGLRSSEAGMFHLTTHAFFKALLFLGAGSLIHAMHTQSIWDMNERSTSFGSLLGKMPVTGITFLIATAALMGIPPFSGFFSKEEILNVAHQGPELMYWMAMAVVFLTAFYMGRLVTVVFFSFRKNHDDGHHPIHESNWKMALPLIILAVLSAIGGYLPIRDILPDQMALEESHAVAQLSLILAALGFGLSFILYQIRPKQGFSSFLLYPFQAILEKKYFFDDLYDLMIKYIQENIARVSDLFERWVVVKFAVNGTAYFTRACGDTLRKLQTGVVQFYAFLFTAGITALIVLFIFWGKV